MRGVVQRRGSGFRRARYDRAAGIFPLSQLESQLASGPHGREKHNSQAPEDHDRRPTGHHGPHLAAHPHGWNRLSGSALRQNPSQRQPTRLRIQVFGSSRSAKTPTEPKPGPISAPTPRSGQPRCSTPVRVPPKMIELGQIPPIVTAHVHLVDHQDHHLRQLPVADLGPR